MKYTWCTSSATESATEVSICKCIAITVPGTRPVPGTGTWYSTVN